MLIGPGGTRQAEDWQAEPAGLQHSARTGMMSAKGAPSATVMNFLTEHNTGGEGLGTDVQYRPLVLTEEGLSAAQNFTLIRRLVHALAREDRYCNFGIELP